MADQQRVRRFLKQRTGLFLNALFFVAVFVAISTFQTRNLLSTSSTTAPALNGPLLRGGNYDIAAAGNRPMLVYFFAPWCKFCAVSSDKKTSAEGLFTLRGRDQYINMVIILYKTFNFVPKMHINTIVFF